MSRRQTSRSGRSLALAVLIGAFWAGGARGYAQSLGEIAAREEARRAAIPAPSPVYSDRMPVPRQSAPAKAAVPALGAAAATGAGSAGPAHEATPHVHRVRTGASSSAPALASSPTGWSPFKIPKSEAELAETARLAGLGQVAARTGPADVRLPPQRDTMRMSTGLGYLQGADFGGDVTGSGRLYGMQTDLSAFLTAGPMGLQARSGRVSLFAADGRWRGEGGNLFSDLRGMARGGRLSWNAGPRWTPSVAFYVPRAASAGTTVVAYRDRFQVLPLLRVGGELASDGSRFLQLQYARSRLNLTGFHRDVSGPHGGRDHGVSGGASLGRGIALSGAVRVSDAVNDSKQWQLASIRLPLARQASVTIERTWWTATATDGFIDAVTLQVPVGPVRLLQRIQWGRTDYLQRAVPFGFGQRQLQSTASYMPGPWGRLNYQQSTQWFDDGRMQQWDELASSVQLGRHTAAQFVTALPDMTDPRRFRARVTHALSPTLSLEAHYGRLSAFQKSRASHGEQSKVMVTIRKIWQLESPARGGLVAGRIVEQGDSPVSGALVRLGPYSTITDEAGAYEFTRVPEGHFELALDKDKLPAAYASDEQPQSLLVARGSRSIIDLRVVPLSTIQGRVYRDRNRNGSFDEGEGVPNVVVAIGDAVTATAADGSYAFYNQPPGLYKVRVEASRLPGRLVPASPPALDVELTADLPLFGVDFTLEEKAVPIIMQEIRP